MLIELVMVDACARFCLEGLAVALVWVSVLLVLVGGLTVSLCVALVWALASVWSFARFCVVSEIPVL